MPDNLFGLPVRYEAWEKQAALPFYIAQAYEFSTMFIGGSRCIAIKPRGELATRQALQKHICKIQQQDHVPVVLLLASVSPYRRKSLIEDRVPFLTPKQAFLPFIGAMLTDAEERKDEVEKFVFSTQQLFLLYLYSRQSAFYVSNEAASLPFSAMTWTRAARQLEASGLFAVTKDGVSRVIQAKYNRLELFEKARRFLQNPIRKWGYADKNDVTADMVFAGETALSEKTMLNPPRLVTYAIWEKKFEKNQLQTELIDPQTQIKLELWAYEPLLFAKDGTADGLSLALSFGGSTDERIEDAVAELVMRTLEHD